MIVDTSAVIAIALQDPGWQQLYQRAVEADTLSMSSGTLQELLSVADRKGILAEVTDLLRLLDLDYNSVDQALAMKGVEIYQHYGKGSGHPAQLNYGDCFAAALATHLDSPLLYTGKDFQAAGF